MSYSPYPTNLVPLHVTQWQARSHPRRQRL